MMDSFNKIAKCLTMYFTSYSAQGRQSMLIVFIDLFVFLLLNCHFVSVIAEEVVNPKYASWNSLESTEDAFTSPDSELTKLTFTTIFLIFGVGAMVFAVILGRGIYKRSSYLVNIWLLPNIFIIIPGGILAIHTACDLQLYYIAMFTGALVVFRAIQCLCVQEYYWELTGKFGIIQHHEQTQNNKKWDQSNSVFEEICI